MGIAVIYLVVKKARIATGIGERQHSAAGSKGEVADPLSPPVPAEYDHIPCPLDAFRVLGNALLDRKYPSSSKRRNLAGRNHMHQALLDRKL